MRSGSLKRLWLGGALAALAVAERIGASGPAFLEAFLVGFEVECKIAEAIDPAQQPPTGEIEIRRAEPVNSTPAGFEAPSLEASPPDPIQFFN